jgi:O-antigen ligase
LELYRIAWQDFAEHPLIGTGYAGINTAHSIYLQILQSAGLVGMLALVIYFAAPLAGVRRELGVRRLDHVTLGVAAAVGVFLIIGLVQNLIYVRAPFIVVGFLWTLGRMKPTSQTQ